MPGQVQDNISVDYNEQFGRPIGVNVVQKLGRFSYLQELGYNGQLSFLKKDFHGLQEFFTHMGMYSKTHPLLTGAWAVIKDLVMKNPFIAAKLFTSSTLGDVGNAFKSIGSFGKIFVVSPSELLSPSKISAKTSAAQNV